MIRGSWFSTLALAIVLLGCPDDEPTDTTLDSGTSEDTAGDTSGGGLDTASVDMTRNLTLRLVGTPPAEAQPNTEITVEFEVSDEMAGVLVDDPASASVLAGGGTIVTLPVPGAGTRTVTWRVGVAPIGNRLSIQVSEGAVAEPLLVDVLVVPEETADPSSFSTIHTYLTDESIEGSTEDLAFHPSEDRLVMGIPGGLIDVASDGTITPVALTGDTLVQPLGVAYDALGHLWVADSEGGALRRVDPEGVVTTVRTDDGTDDLAGPNYVAVGPGRTIYLSDPCLGEVIAINGETGEVLDVLSFDLPTEGGPNGLALSPDGTTLWAVTENTAILCSHAEVLATDPLATLFEVALTETGFGDRTTIAEELGAFGDGLAFDAEGNLYVVIDQFAGFSLDNSSVWVLRPGETELVQFLRVENQLIANVAFGRGVYGETNLYLSLLAFTPITAADSRGLLRFDVQVPGLELLPQANE